MGDSYLDWNLEPGIGTFQSPRFPGCPSKMWLDIFYPMKVFRFSALLLLATIFAASAAPRLLDDQFELPEGFHIYRAATAEQSGGSYALTFDGEGRLLVGDGNALRRLNDKDGDGVYDSFETIATGLGWRGPQGLLVYGDKLFAVGGDGLQLFEGYSSGELVHKGRLGQKFLTGNDHDAHQIFRGHDGYIYFVVGNGAEAKDRLHITETNSPVMFEREACVFRISPDGQKWECLSAGGRNPPNLGMNYLGDLFSFDSDMEWHVALPWYRPVRLNQWFIGGDLGWQEVGAYAPYFIDNLPGILDVGRGSPTWGTFYEHNQFPEKYRDAYIVCDYRWKVESNDQYNSTGRLVVFFLQRNGATWKASMETLAKPKPNAKDADGKPINFALVDCQVGPDGSVFVADHNQGVWRIFYDAENRSFPGIVPRERIAHPIPPNARVSELLSLPQPQSERARIEAQALSVSDEELKRIVLDSKSALKQRLRALRFLSPKFADLPQNLLLQLAKDKLPELRGQAAWLLGLRQNQKEVPNLLKLFEDKDPFVRRRAAESLTRFASPQTVPPLINHLNDPERTIRFICMDALAHLPTQEWFEKAASRPEPQIKMRALVASLMRREPASDEQVWRVVGSLLSPLPRGEGERKKENELDLLRVLALFEKQVASNIELKSRLLNHLLDNFPDADSQVRWEKSRLLGLYRLPQGFAPLLELLENETDRVTQFHLARMLSRIESGWTPEEETRLLNWFLAQQRGWFAEFSGKGVEFPDFWATVLNEFGQHHHQALLHELSRLDFAGQLGGVALNLLAKEPNADRLLIKIFGEEQKLEAKTKVAKAFKKVHTTMVAEFLRPEIPATADENLKGTLLQSLAAQPFDLSHLDLLEDGLNHANAEVARSCADAIERGHPKLSEKLAMALLARMTERQDLFEAMQKCLSTLSGKTVGRFKVDPKVKSDDAPRQAMMEFWKAWFEEAFHHPFAGVSQGIAERSDEDLRKFILSDALKGGDALRGVKVYETIGCNNCHGGGVTPGQEGKIFGPDLNGVTRRLSRNELADSIVYPSKQIAERFRASEVELKDGTTLTGFITEQSEEAVTLATRDDVQKISRAKIEKITPQSISLMPEHLLNRASEQDIRDLLSFLDNGAVKTAEKK